MTKVTRYVGLDVHAETIAAAIGEGHGRVRSLGQFPNRPESVRKLIAQVGGPQDLKVCYEAGPTGYALYWQLTKMGVECDVVAPSLIPKKPGEKIKTDRRDAEKLAQCYQSGTLTSVWVPDAAHEALRDLVRARAAAKKDESRAKHRARAFKWIRILFRCWVDRTPYNESRYLSALQKRQSPLLKFAALPPS